MNIYKILETAFLINVLHDYKNSVKKSKHYSLLNSRALPARGKGVENPFGLWSDSLMNVQN